MKILQLTNLEYASIQEDAKFKHLILEGQVYGQDSDLLYHVAVSDQTAEDLSKKHIFRIIADKGRSIGMWQYLGGKGIFRKDLAKLQGFSQNVIDAITSVTPAQITFAGDTWEEIIRITPINQAIKDVLGVSIIAPTKVPQTATEEKPVKTRKGSKKAKNVRAQNEL